MPMTMTCGRLALAAVAVPARSDGQTIDNAPHRPHDNCDDKGPSPYRSVRLQTQFQPGGQQHEYTERKCGAVADLPDMKTNDIGRNGVVIVSSDQRSGIPERVVGEYCRREHAKPPGHDAAELGSSYRIDNRRGNG